jgi:hypothetical protein
MEEDKKELSQKVLDKIKEKNIQPKPRWECLLKEYLIWIFGTGSLLVGGLAFSVVIYMFVTNDWDVYEYIDESFFGFIVATLPYFWLLFLALFIFIADYNFKQTKTGYRYKLIAIISVSVFISMFLGMVFYVAGMGKIIDRTFSENVPQYYHIMNKRMIIWKHPEKGLLSGVVVEVFSNTEFKLKDTNNIYWSVDGQGAVVMGEINLIRKGERLRIIGKRLNENNFKALRIMPWIPMHVNMKKSSMIHFRLKNNNTK